MVLSLVAAASLGGCIINYDAAVPAARFVNDYDETVVVTYEGTELERESMVPPGDYTIEGMNNCIGTGLSIRTASGELLGKIAEPACPHWELIINEDGSLTYREQGKETADPSQ
ncbi:hypothetical protein [Demequina sp.]|uniref:hypothetical protein n=1 Tax=Demequina sp. TaxID=2050685 RepID=UPI003D1112CC